MDGPNPVAPVFSRWGRPERFRVDNGTPWGSCGDLPTDLALWLIGLEMGMIWNPPRQPQKNGKVERSQGVGQAWAEPWTCRSASELQQRIREMDHIQREEYPHRDGRSRWSLFPGLKHSGRVYDETWERRHWNLDLVLEHLAQYLMSRQVDQAGKISLYEPKLLRGQTTPRKNRVGNVTKQLNIRTHNDTADKLGVAINGQTRCR